MKIQVTADLLDGLVLALLKESDYYGYTLTQSIQKVLIISESTMYPVLKRLQKNNYLTTYDEKYQGRNRRYYQITTAGVKHLQKIEKLWEEYKRSLDSIFKGDEKDG